MRLESLSRRGVLTLAGACLIPWKNLYAREFWDKKDPSQWTGEEIDQLTTKSPWAKSVNAQYAPGDHGDQRGGGGYPGGSRTPNSYPPPWGGGGGGVGIGFPRRGGMGRPGGASQSSNFKGTVRWESAQPLLDALKTPLPDAFANLYVIGTRDIPYLENNRQRRSQNSNDNDQDQPKLSKPDTDNDASSDKRDIDRIKTITTIQVKGKGIVSPTVVQQMTPGGSYFLFGFPKDALDFGKKDHEIDFSTQLGRLLVKAKFDPSEMLYRGNLAV